MSPYPLYQITPVYLHEQLTPPPLATGAQGHYLVFWWHDIALGHCFLAPGTAPDYSEALIAAIAPSLLFYAKHHQQDKTADWKQWIRNNCFGDWSAWMRELFQGCSPATVPARVPVTAIICTRNRAAQLSQCLARLTRLSCQASEIIVVDNASDDEATRQAAGQFEGVVYVKEPRIGLDVARNTGIQKSSFPIVAFVDDDVTVHPFWVYRVWETLQSPAVAAMTGLVIASELQTEAQYLFERYWSFNRGYTDKTYDSAFFSATLPQGPPVWEIGAGANMAFRKEVFEQVGYFHELLDVGAAGCNGDSEMWYRVLSHGYTICYNPRAIVFHEHRKELKALKRQIFYYMRGHTAAALIQQSQQRQAGYRRYLLKLFMKSFTLSIIRGFPDYASRYTTLWAQIGGAASGMAFYFRNKARSKTAQVN